MTHESGHIIILSVVITPELAACLDRKIPSGAFGSTREEVAQGYLCRSFSVAAPAKPEQAAPVAEETPGGTEPGGTTPPDPAPPGGPAVSPGDGGVPE